MRYLECLRKPSVIGVSFAATIGITLAFAALPDLLGLRFIDALSDPVEVRAAIATMTPDQRAAHAWITATLDIAYPLAYASFFAGMALRGFPRAGYRLAALVLLAIPVDLFEGLVQVLALTGTADALASKAVVTPLKFALFASGAAIAVLAALRALGRLVTAK